MDKERLERIHREIRADMAQSFGFWIKNGFDKVNGGFYTCLDRQGKRYSTDKSVWMQGRCAWLFSHLCNVYGERGEWREAAVSCLGFLRDKCVNPNAGGRLYFTVTCDGKPLRQRRYFFSECFYAMACAEYYKLSGEKEWLNTGVGTFDMVWGLLNGEIEDPVGHPHKTELIERRGQSLAGPMIYMNMCDVFARCNPENEARYTERARICAGKILRLHFKPQLGCTLETVGNNGEFWREVSAGRVVNPGHDFECAWFLLELAAKLNDHDMRAKALDMMEYAWEAGHDREYGGILYFVDALGFPPESYEHDMKLWWPHNELLTAALTAYRDTGDEKHLDRFYEIYGYSRKVFYDPEFGDWYGYLRRDGKPTLPAAKGSTYKGPFHLGRMYIMLDSLLTSLLN